MRRRLIFVLSLLVIFSPLLCVKLGSVGVKAVNLTSCPYHTIFQGAENEIHDVTVVNVSLSEYVAYVGEEVGIEVVVRNEGNFTEKFNVSVYVNQTSELTFVDAYLVVSLGSLDQISIPFVWDTYGFASGNYTVEVGADVVDGEIDIMDNKRASDRIWIKADNTAPVIGVPVQNPLLDEVWEHDQVMISVNVSDLGSGISRVILAWRIKDWVLWQQQTMAHSTENMYQDYIPSFGGGTNVSYRIIAYDEAGNEAVRDHGGSYYVYQVIPEFPSFLILPLFLISTLLAVIVLHLLNTIPSQSYVEDKHEHFLSLDILSSIFLPH